MNIGEKINHLTLVEDLGMRKKNHFGLFKCDCGNFKEIRISNVTTNNTKSCGCMAHRPNGNNRKHGICYTRPYHIWERMKQRCNNPNYKEYDYYGGRGISICEEWKNPKNFYDWAMENGYADNLSIDRIDVNKGYEPSNCRWATPKEQCNNKRNNIRITLYGETKTLAQWCEELNLSYGMVRARIKRGWSYERALLN